MAGLDGHKSQDVAERTARLPYPLRLLLSERAGLAISQPRVVTALGNELGMWAILHDAPLR